MWWNISYTAIVLPALIMISIFTIIDRSTKLNIGYSDHKWETSIIKEFHARNYGTKDFLPLCGGFPQSFDPVKQVKFELVCKKSSMASSGKVDGYRLFSAMAMQHIKHCKYQKLYHHRGTVLTEGSHLCRLLSVVGIRLSGTLWYLKLGVRCTSSLGAHLEKQHFCMGEFCECSRGEQLPPVLSKDK